jgi:hypothetical protein
METFPKVIFWQVEEAGSLPGHPDYRKYDNLDVNFELDNGLKCYFQAHRCKDGSICAEIDDGIFMLNLN